MFNSYFLILIVAATAVLGHVTVQPPKAAINAYVVNSIRIPHGCNGTGTIAVSLKIPDGVTVFRPGYLATSGWEVSTTNRTHTDGTNITDTATWRNTDNKPVPDSMFWDIPFQWRTPSLSDGSRVIFPINQTCVGNLTDSWTQVPDSNAGPNQPSLLYPAPAVVLYDPTTTTTPNDKPAPSRRGEENGAHNLHGIGLVGISLLVIIISLMNL